MTVKFNRFQGDPKIDLTDSGATMTFRSGQPVMDQGLENAAVISLFTLPGWWGNSVLQDPNKQIGSKFSEPQTITNLQTINDKTNQADLALKWMKTVNLASAIDIEVTNPYNDQLKTDILITPPGSDAEELLFTKNGINWIQQANNPAYKKV